MEAALVPPSEGSTGRFVVVADGSRARVFEVYPEAPGLRPALAVDLTIPRLQEGERWADRAGQTHERRGHGMHSMAPPTDATEHQQDLLARNVAETLRRARVEHRMDALVLVAAPAFLGKLRSALDGPTRALVIAEDGRDLSQLPEHELETSIPTEVWPDGAPPSRRGGIA